MQRDGIAGVLPTPLPVLVRPEPSTTAISSPSLIRAMTSSTRCETGAVESTHGHEGEVACAAEALGPPDDHKPTKQIPVVAAVARVFRQKRRFGGAIRWIPVYPRLDPIPKCKPGAQAEQGLRASGELQEDQYCCGSRREGEALFVDARLTRSPSWWFPS